MWHAHPLETLEWEQSLKSTEEHKDLTKVNMELQKADKVILAHDYWRYIGDNCVI